MNWSDSSSLICHLHHRLNWGYGPQAPGIPTAPVSGAEFTFNYEASPSFLAHEPEALDTISGLTQNVASVVEL